MKIVIIIIARYKKVYIIFDIFSLSDQYTVSHRWLQGTFLGFTWLFGHIFYLIIFSKYGNVSPINSLHFQSLAEDQSRCE